MDYDIKDIKLAAKGRLRIEWAANNMPVLELIKKRFAKEKPLKDTKIAACLHVTTETAVLMDALKTAGAAIRLCASNPLSTQDDVAASLTKHFGIPVFAIKGEDDKTYYRHIHAALDHGPHVTLDDGADLVATIHKEHRDLIPGLLGGTEETTTGVIRLRALANQGKLEEAFGCCEEAVSADKCNARLHYLLATILEEQKQVEEARVSLKKALYLDRNFVLAHFALANISLRSGKVADARKHFSNVTEILSGYKPDDIIPESEGITAGRLAEIIGTFRMREMS